MVQEIQELFYFIIKHQAASIILFIITVLIFQSKHLLFLALKLFADYPRIRNIVAWITKNVFCCKPSSIYYKYTTDAVILSNLDQCKPYLDLHFSSDESGQIWLFRSDLRGFWDETIFKELYLDIFDKRNNISEVKIILSKKEIDRLDTAEWKSVYSNLAKLNTLRNESIKYAIVEDFKNNAEAIIKEENFFKYVSDESFVFYTRTKKLYGKETICIHRRVSEKVNVVHDLRITLIAAWKWDGLPNEGLHKFMQQPIAIQFETLFSSPNNDIQWEQLSKLAFFMMNNNFPQTLTGVTLRPLMQGLQETNMSESFHVFLSHNSQDKPIVRKLAQALKSYDLRVWLDEEQLAPGCLWGEALETIIQTTQAAVVLIGKNGMGPWEDPEMRACLSEFVKRKMPVIPVLLP